MTDPVFAGERDGNTVRGDINRMMTKPKEVRPRLPEDIDLDEPEAVQMYKHAFECVVGMPVRWPSET